MPLAGQNMYRYACNIMPLYLYFFFLCIYISVLRFYWTEHLSTPNNVPHFSHYTTAINQSWWRLLLPLLLLLPLGHMNLASHICFFFNCCSCFITVQCKESAIYPLPHAWAHGSPWLAGFIIERVEREMLSLSPRKHGRFYFFGL